MINWNMKENDNIIKKTLQSNIQRIDDDSFTKSIIEKHLAKKQVIKNRPFINFMSLIIGLSSVIISIGFVLLIRQNCERINGMNLTENHGLILLALSIIFLIYKWVEEYTAPNVGNHTKQQFQYKDDTYYT